MRTFTIDSENNITAHSWLPVDAETSTHFASQTELAKLTADWPVARLIETWNSFAGVAPFSDLKPVKKFTDRKAAVSRLWKAIDRLSPLVAEPAREVAPEKKKATKSPAKPKRSHTARPSAKAPAHVSGEGSKKAEVIDLMRRPGGVSLAEIQDLTGWQPHTVRGFVSILGSKGGHTIESSKGGAGQRTYRIAK